MRFQGFVDRFNSCALALRDSRRFGAAVSRRLTIVSYVGRRSGKEFQTPVAYKRQGGTVLIAVQMPDAKKWWRNFEGEGYPLALELDGRKQSGHAVARRDGRSRVLVTVTLD
ncbi:nitroreductase family deazaflavin-dependent oxidoreductase [Paractinoplanes bogorensis]|nr:nitroreductase family deazaflavin-dependent oxidoreductase [Actinoplanes bogorensis]